jgi:hypothetical protein
VTAGMLLLASIAVAAGAYFATTGSRAPMSDSTVHASDKPARPTERPCPDTRWPRPRADAPDYEYERFVALADAAQQELEAGRLDRAAVLASELLRLAPRYRHDWNYGNAIHHGNTVLGRIALARGNVQKARARLLASAAIEGSPQLNSFGPSMALASRLLKRGEIAVVLLYLARCRSFWEMGQQKLDRWQALLIAGQTPDFGYNRCM